MTSALDVLVGAALFVLMFAGLVCLVHSLRVAIDAWSSDEGRG